MDLTEVQKQLDLASTQINSKATRRLEATVNNLIAAMRALVEQIEFDDDRAWEESQGEDL